MVISYQLSVVSWKRSLICFENLFLIANFIRILWFTHTALFVGAQEVYKTGINNFLCFDECTNPFRNRFGFLFKHSLTRLNKFATVLKDVSLICLLAENVLDTCLDSGGCILIYAEFLCDCVGCYKSDAVNIIGETIRILCDDGDCIVFISLINLCSVCCADIVGLEEEHNVFNLALCFPRLLDDLYAMLSDAGDTC